jgi:hypothetical protein
MMSVIGTLKNKPKDLQEKTKKSYQDKFSQTSEKKEMKKKKKKEFFDNFEK